MFHNPVDVVTTAKHILIRCKRYQVRTTKPKERREKKMKNGLIINDESSPWCAYGPEKQTWKEDGNYYTREELLRMEHIDDVTLGFGSGCIYSAD